MWENSPSSAHWALEQGAACISGSDNPLEKSLVCHQLAHFHFTDCPAHQKGQMLLESLGQGWWDGDPLPAPQGLAYAYHPHLVTASLSQGGKQHPLWGWLQGPLRAAHDSQGRLEKRAFIPSYQHNRGYSCWELGSSAARQLQAGLIEEGRISNQNLFQEDVPWNWKHVIMWPPVPGCHVLITLLTWSTALSWAWEGPPSPPVPQDSVVRADIPDGAQGLSGTPGSSIPYVSGSIPSGITCMS